MKSAAFNKLISETYSVPEKTVVVQARFLKEAGLLTTGARGVNAPEMTALDAARMTIAVLATDSPAQTVERVRRFGPIPYRPDFQKGFQGYENIGQHRFNELFTGETLEDVLAGLFALPNTLGIEKASEWFDENLFHLRIQDFDILAELFRWKVDGQKIVGELVVPFKGDAWDKSFNVITGHIRTTREIGGLNFLGVGVMLMDETSNG